MALIEGTTGEWEMVIGLEVHAQAVTEAKLFSGADTEFGAEPNSQVSLVDAAMPGMLPVINERCVEQAVRTGLGLNAEINLVSVFDRKNYFYPDLPAGYQISQYLQPIVGKGEIVLDMPDGETRTVGITRLHLEQDAGKSLHDQDPRRTFVDLNRAGVGLMEIVSEPDIRSAEEAAAYLTKMRSILRYLGTCDGNMEQGSMRADVNVSVRRPGGELGTRCEIKNVNSIRFVKQAIEYEARRQVEIIEDGGEIVQETRLFDPDKGETRSMRSKEEAHDYRYFPDPDLLPLVLEQDWVDAIKASLPELPDQKKARFMADLGLSAYDAGQLVADKTAAGYFEAVATGRDAKQVANWVTGELFGQLNRADKKIAESPVSAEALGALIDLIADNTISGRIAKDVFIEMFNTGQQAAEIVKEKGLKQITDTGAIEAAVEKVIDDNPAQVAKFKAGEAKVAGWFVGQVMKATSGKANPKLVNRVFDETKANMKHAYDVFVSHASEDKEEFVRPLVDALRSLGLRVWYDDFSLKLGDSLRASIDRGLSEARFGLVVLSPNFFAKHWPQQELNGLAGREAEGVKVILPIWHEIDLEEVRQHSPTLADRIATKSEYGLSKVVQDILEVIEPGSEVTEPPVLPSPTIAKPAAIDLDAWKNRCLERWQILAKGLPENHHARMPHGHWHVAYGLEIEESLPSGSDLLDAIDRATIRHTGWPMFWVPTREDIAPYPIDGVIECWIGQGTKFEEPSHTDLWRVDPSHADLWRVDPSGLFFLMRGYQEDNPERGLTPGKLFDVTLPAWRIGEAILHSISIAEAVGANDGQALLKATWTGLEGRTLTSLDRSRIMGPTRYTSRQNEFTSEKSYSLADAKRNLPALVDEIVRPLYELFDFFKLPADLTMQEIARMRSSRY